jgi:hypothetical protein
VRSRGADKWREFAHTCLRRRGHGWHAPFGAPLPSLMTGSKSFLASSWLAKLGRMRAPRERFCLSARGLILSPLPRAGEVASEASGRGTVAAVPSQAAAPPHPDLLPACGEKACGRAAKRFCLSAPARSAGEGDRATARWRGMRRFVRSDRQSKRRRPRPFHRPSGGPPSPPCGAGWEIPCDEN